jgi:copper chaperone CopZ
MTVSGMTCGHCRKKVEDALQAVDGVVGAFVDLDAGEAEVDFDDARTGVEALTKAVEASGYGAAVPS